MIELVCLTLLGMTLFLLCLFMFINRTLSKKIGGQALIFIAVLIVCFALVFKPENFIRWDLIEHFKLVDNMRSGGLRYVTAESQYADLFVFNFFAYFISILPKECQNLLTVIPLIVDFLIVGYVYKKMFYEHLPETDGKTRVLSILLWLFTFGMKLAISGIRCSLAVSIVFLAIYLEMIQKKKKPLSIFLYVISIFIHNFAIAVIAVRLLTMIKKPIFVMLSSLGLSFLLEPVARFIVKNVDNDYITFSFGRILDTVEDMSFTNAIQQYDGSTLVIYLCFVAVAVYLFVVATKAKLIYTEDGYCKNAVNFAATVGAVAIGLSFNYLYLERFMFLISFALLLITPLHNRGKNSINPGNLILLPMTLFLFFFNDIYLFMVNYIGDYFLAL